MENDALIVARLPVEFNGKTYGKPMKFCAKPRLQALGITQSHAIAIKRSKSDLRGHWVMDVVTWVPGW